MKKSIICLNCGASHLVSKYKLNPKYCSVKCGSIHTASIRGNKLRGKGNKTYIKYNGEHLHRNIIETKLGRKLTSNEIVHHKDLDKFNNNIENLEVMNKSEHTKLHSTKNRICTIPGCNNKHRCIGLCNSHYRKVRYFNRKNK